METETTGAPLDFRALSYGEVAERLGVSRKSVQRLVKAGEFRAIRIGGSVRVAEEELRLYLERQGVSV
ncbi:MAG: helix-turn-helix domain-containing protein [Chloroflexi bacterium]|nr:helix-turn-helix domain-containing protein [Dehalococcoidia bacterium]NJD65946.1 helix-turn-helix domain-containing protein [Chloroflexota bacterium]PWB44993.1 MAG: excisionase [Dehalococcoidia bacterium]